MDSDQLKLEIEFLKKELEAKEKLLREKDMLFNIILEHTFAGYWDWNIPEDYEYLSPSLKKMLGYEDHELANEPESWKKIIHPEDLPLAIELFEAHVRTKGRVPYDSTVRYQHKDGSIVWVYCRGKIIEWDSEGKPIRMVGSHVDVTPLKKIEAELLEKNRALEYSNAQLDDFAYTVSHDLKEPLRGIKNYSRALLKHYYGKFDGKGQSKLEGLERLTVRMENLIESVLYYSRLGRTELALVEVNIHNLVLGVIGSMQFTEKEKVEISVPKPLPSSLCDEIRIREVFTNLITNAVKYNTKPKKLIEVGFLESEKKKAPVIFYVKDNGIGIKEKHWQSMFDIFRRLHHRDKFGGGTGVGLTIVKKIVERHRGKIWVDSVYEEGSTFFFTLGS